MERSDRRGTSRQAPPRQTYYPRWGIEEPPRRTNAHSLYRYGEQGFLTRLIIPADDRRRYFAHGLSIGELLIILAVLGFIRLMGEVAGIGLEGYLQTMGW